MKSYPELIFLENLQKTPTKISNWKKKYNPSGRFAEYHMTELRKVFTCQINGLISQARELGFKIPEFEMFKFPEAFDIAIENVEEIEKDFMNKFDARLKAIAKEKDEFINLDVHGNVRKRGNEEVAEEETNDDSSVNYKKMTKAQLIEELEKIQ